MITFTRPAEGNWAHFTANTKVDSINPFVFRPFINEGEEIDEARIDEIRTEFEEESTTYRFYLQNLRKNCWLHLDDIVDIDEANKEVEDYFGEEEYRIDEIIGNVDGYADEFIDDEEVTYKLMFYVELVTSSYDDDMILAYVDGTDTDISEIKDPHYFMSRVDDKFIGEYDSWYDLYDNVYSSDVDIPCEDTLHYELDDDSCYWKAVCEDERGSDIVEYEGYYFED